MNCPYCGNEIPEGSRFCPNCGAAAEKAETNKEQSDAQPVVQPAVQTAAQTPEPKKSPAAVIVLVCAIVACIAVIGVLLWKRGDEKTPDSTTDQNETTSASDVTGEDASQIPEGRELAYPDGFDYLNADLDKYITLGKYKGLSAVLTTSSEVTDADVKSYVDSMLSQYAEAKEITDRAVKEGDTLNVNYSGKLDGVAFDGGTAENQEIVLGNGGFIDGFEEGMVGMKVGETKTIDATFPDPYSPNPDLAGKTVQFDITLNSATENVAPTYNDAFVKETFDMDSTAAFEAAVLELLKNNRESEILSEKHTACLSAATDNATVVAYPEGLVEDYMQQQLDSIRYYATMYGMSYEDLIMQGVGMSVADYEAEIRKDAESAVKEELVIHAVAKAEGFTISDAEYDAELAEFLDYYGYEDIASMCADYGITESYIGNTIRFSLAYNYAMDKLVDNATFTGAK